MGSWSRASNGSCGVICWARGRTAVLGRQLRHGDRVLPPGWIGACEMVEFGCGEDRTGEVMDNSGESTGWNRALFSLASTQLCPSTPAIGAIPGKSGSGFQFSGQASPRQLGWWGRRVLRDEVEPRNWPALNFFVGLQGRGPWILVEVPFGGKGKLMDPAEPANRQHEVRNFP